MVFWRSVVWVSAARAFSSASSCCSCEICLEVSVIIRSREARSVWKVATEICGRGSRKRYAESGHFLLQLELGLLLGALQHLVQVDIRNLLV